MASFFLTNRKWFIFFLVSFFLLISCTPETDVPPEPPSIDAGSALAGQAYRAGVCYTAEQLQASFSPADIITVNEPVIAGNELRVEVSHNKFIYLQGHLLKNCDQWQSFEFSPTENSRRQGSRWIQVTNRDAVGATYTLPIDETFSTDGSHYVLAYACRRVGNQWDCHDNRFMLVEFRVQEEVAEKEVPACVSQSEICDGADNDCDTIVDNNIPLQECATELAGVCSAGMQRCQEGAWSACTPTAQPSAELCNNVDDDCDGLVDNNIDLQSDLNNCGACGVICSAGQSCQEGVCRAPPIELNQFPLIELSQCEQKGLNQPNTIYALTADLTYQIQTGTCLTVFAPGITVDCRGHAIIGEGKDVGISLSGRGESHADRVTVKNCEISGFNYGISIGRDIQNARIEENTLHDNKYGIALQPGALGGIIANNHLLQNNQGIVLYTSLSNTISQNSICETYQSVRCVSPEIAISGDGNVFDGMLNPCPANWPQEGVHYSLCPES